MNRPTLPVGDKPDWESEDPESAQANKSIAESFVVLQSLRQTREFWLSSVFPKFSSKGKGKVPDVVPPPHSLYSRGRCDLEIGPLVFPDTAFYEVHYLPVYSSADSKSATPYSSAYTPYGQQAAQPTTAVASSPLLSSLSSLTTITPVLINTVNSAASTNPTLANLLQLAAGGHASADQLKTLGLLIQSLANTDLNNTTPTSSSSTNPAITQAPSVQVPPKEFDFVLEFQDIPHERFLFPRVPVVCERLSDSDCRAFSSDVTISVGVPFLQSPPPSAEANSPNPDPANPANSTEPSHVVTLLLKKASPAIWDTISRWAGTLDKVQQNRDILAKIKEPERVFVAHHLAEGPLLNLLQAAAAPTFTMKLIDPAKGGAPKQRRKATQRKQAADGSSRQKQQPSTASTPAKSVSERPVPSMPTPTNPTPSVPPMAGVLSLSSPSILSLAPPAARPYPHTPSSLYTYPPAAVLPLAPNTILSLAPPGHTHTPPPAAPARKKKRTVQPKPPIMKISCHSCGQTDVPLVLGGRFCRPCVENGKADLDIPQPLKFPAYSPTPYAKPYLTLTPQHIANASAAKSTTAPPASSGSTPSNPSGSTSNAS